MISNSWLEQNNIQLILKIPIRYFGKTSEISLELIKKIKNHYQFKIESNF